MAVSGKNENKLIPGDEKDQRYAITPAKSMNAQGSTLSWNLGKGVL